MKKEIRIFFTALMFFTRIPCPSFADHSEEYLNKSTRYFPMMGWIVGGISAVCFWAFHFVFSVELSLVLAMAASVIVTGAFHEDGFADVCDGFGGGWTREKILDIMKDSRVGAFGMIGAFFMLTTKFFALKEVDPALIPALFIAGHSVSRFFSATIIFTQEYARVDMLSKAKPLAKKVSNVEFAFGAFTGLLPLVLFLQWWILLTLPVIFLAYWWITTFFRKWIGGYTGDCLGAAQQVFEVVFYLTFIVLWKSF